MFLLNDKPLPLDTAFEHNEVSYPANWLRLATPEEREALGITEIPDPVRADDRFYWNGDINNPKALEDRAEVKEDGTPLYVQVYDPVTESMVDTDKQVITKGLKSVFIAQVKQTAGTMLSSTDWMVIRKAERGVDIPASVTAERQSIVAQADAIETAIQGVSTVEELASLNMSIVI